MPFVWWRKKEKTSKVEISKYLEPNWTNPLVMEFAAMQNLGWSGQIMAVGGTFLFLYFIWRAVKFFRERPIVLPPMFSPGNQHHWRSIDILTHTAYCNVCECLIVDGMHCDYCGLCVDLSCSKKANIKCRCKTLWYPEFVNEPMLHNWVRGNLAAHSLCDVCQEECGDESCLFDYRCCWCQRTVHEVNCFNTCKSSECDFGEWRRYMVPPFCIKYKTTWSKGRRKLVVDNVEKFHDEANWFPLLVIANTKSGNNDGEKVLRAFRAILNPLQVIDLNEYSMEEGLEWCRVLLKNYKDADIRVLIAGGDGTIGWVLNTFEKLKLDPKPLVGILPLGTGNDLSKILGWGQSFSCESSLRHLMRKVLAAQMVSLDRWKIKLSPNRSLRLGIPLPSKNLFFNNYFSVGVDALVALEFHQTRESKIYNYLFNNRFFNKFLYLSYGTKDVLERKCKKLNEKIKLEIDGREIELPELESVVILNIPSWGGGAHIWSLGNNEDVPQQKINDQLIEVLGIYSSFHIGQMLIGLSEPLRFGQAKVVKLKLLDRLPIQVDGEPWLQFPTTITVSWHSQAQMLSNKPEAEVNYS